MFGRLGWPEIVIILVIVLIVFGVGKLPQVGDALGRGLRAFKKGQSGEEAEDSSKKASRKKSVKS